jgi:2-dehydropantoate 2-reductase
VRPHAIAESPHALEPAELVVFAVKLPDAQAGAAQLAPLIRPGTVVLPLQNGVEIGELLASEFGADAVAGGVAYIATRIAAPGVIAHSGNFARLRFGALKPAQHDVLREFLAACQRADIDAQMLPDIRLAIWEKFVFLVGISSLTTLTRLPIGVTRVDAQLRQLLLDVMAEAAALARAEGLPIAEDFVAKQMDFIDGLPAGMTASMLNDLQAGAPLELPWLAGAVVRRGERMGLATPANRFITAALSPYVNGTPANRQEAST